MPDEREFDVVIKEIHWKLVRVRAQLREEAPHVAAAMHRAFPLIAAREAWLLTDPDEWLIEEVRAGSENERTPSAADGRSRDDVD